MSKNNADQYILWITYKKWQQKYQCTNISTLWYIKCNNSLCTRVIVYNESDSDGGDIIDWWRDVIVLFGLCLRILNVPSPSFMGRFRIISPYRSLLNLNSPLLCCCIFIAGGSNILLSVTFLLDL